MEGERWRRWRTRERLRNGEKLPRLKSTVYKEKWKKRRTGERGGRERERDERTIRKKTGSIWSGKRTEMEQVVRVASDRDTKQKLEVVIHLSLNIGITRMPGIPTFIPRGAFYIHRDIRTIARNKTFFAMLAVPPFFPSLNSHKEGKTR